jgi:hypothetical protein
MPLVWHSETRQLTWIGSNVHRSLTSDAAQHIRSASAAFGALKNCWRASTLILKFKGRNMKFNAYGMDSSIVFVISIIVTFESCAVFTIAYSIRHRILSASLFDTHYNRRLLRWTDDVVRMPYTQAPRKILTTWVNIPRPRGCPQINWGRTLKKALLSNDIPTEFVKWRKIAADRNQWCAICGSKIPSASKDTPTSSRQVIWLSSDTALYLHEYKSLLGNSRWAIETKTSKKRVEKYMQLT